MAYLIQIFLERRRKKKRSIGNGNRNNNIQTVLRHLTDNENPFESITDEDFKKLYCFPKSLCLDLIEELEPFMQRRQKIHGIPKYVRVLSTLRFFTDGCSQRIIGNHFSSSLSQTSISRCIKEIARAIGNLASKYVKVPEIADYDSIKSEFLQIAGFPGIIGTVDCTHIKICAPLQSVQHEYKCQQGGHSINVQIVCDARYLISSVNAYYGGSILDADIWKQSTYYEILENRYNARERNFWLLGNSKYPLQPWLMTPILQPANDSEDRYNIAHKITQNVVERCIGILKNRFRCLSIKNVLYYSPENARLIVEACVILHNKLILSNVQLSEIENVTAKENTVAEENSNIDFTVPSTNSLAVQGRIEQKLLIRNHFGK